MRRRIHESPSRRARGGGALRISFLEGGCGRTGTALLWHGLGSSARQWSEGCCWTEALGERGYRVLAPDLPGHGESDTPADREGLGLDALGELCADFARLEVPGSGPILWIAHSLGCLLSPIALALLVEIAPAVAARVERVWLLSMPTARRIPPIYWPALAPVASRWLAPLLGAFPGVVSDAALALSLRDGVRSRDYWRLRRVYRPKPATLRVLVDMIEKNRALIPRARPILERLPPVHEERTLVVHGELDRQFRIAEVAETVRLLWPAASWLTVRGAAHALMEDRPDLLAYLLAPGPRPIMGTC